MPKRCKGGVDIPGERKKLILRAVIDDYITTAEPVASKQLAAELGKFSPATLRNEMNELETMGYLEKPHTSAGRVPSAKGYRLYVDELMVKKNLTPLEVRHIENALVGTLGELDRLMGDARRMIAALSGYAVYAGTVRSENVRLRKVELVMLDSHSVIIIAVFDASTVKNRVTERPPETDEDATRRLAAALTRKLSGKTAEEMSAKIAVAAAEEAGVPPSFGAAVVDFLREAAESLLASGMSVDGASRMLEQPEYRDTDKARRLLDYLGDRETLRTLPAPEEDGKLKILIGPENVSEELRDSGVVAAGYDLGDGVRALIGVVGPTRMDYSGVAARLGYLIQKLGRLSDKDNNRSE